MAVVIRLQGLPMVAGTMDIRHFFSGLTIPDGGVHIVGGEQGEAFIVFGNDEHARLGIQRSGGLIKNSKVSLSLSSKNEMQSMIDLSRRRFESGATAAAAETAAAAAPAIAAGNGSRQGGMAQVQGGGSGGRGGGQTGHSNQGYQGNVQASVSQASVAHEHQSKPAVSLVNMMPSFTNTHSTGPPPIPPLPSIPAMPPITSLPSMAGPPPGSTLPPVPTVSPLSQGPHHVPPMSHLHQHMSSLPPFNPSLPPPAGMGTGMGTGLPLGTPGPMLFNPLNHLNPLASLGLQAHMKAAAAASAAAAGPTNPDEVFVLLQNLPFTCSEGDVREFFRGLGVDGVRLLRDGQGRPSGRAIVKFYSPQDCFEAVKRGGAMMGQRFIEITPATERQWASLNGNAMTTGPASHSNNSINLKQQQNNNQPQDQHRRGNAASSVVGGGGGGREQRGRSRSPHRQEFCVYLKGLPYEVQKPQIQEFFKNLNIVEDSIYIAYGPAGRATGEGFLEFRVEQDYKTALGAHMQYMGSRFIQVHPISKKAMLEKIDSIRKRSTPGDGKQHQDGPKPPRNCAHITNIPYNVSRKDVRSFLEGVGIYEDSLKILTDSHGNGLGQSVFQLRTEEDGRKAERLHRQKLNGRDAFVHLVTYDQMKEIERNPPPQNKRGQRNNQQQSQSPAGQNQIQNPTGQSQNQLAPQPPLNPFAAMTGEEFNFLRSTMGNLNSPGPFLSPFSAPGSGLAGPPPLPALAAGLGGDMGGLGMPPSLVAGLPGGPILEPPTFRPGSAPFGQESLRGIAPFDPANRKGGAGGQNRAGGGGANANPGRPVGGANQQQNNLGNPGNPSSQRGNGTGNLAGGGPTIVKLQNMPFTVTVDEILDFFYGYQVLPGSVCLQFSDKGLPTGEAMVAFQAQQEAAAAVMELNDRPIGARKVKISLG